MGLVCRVNIVGRYTEINKQILDKKEYPNLDYLNEFNSDFKIKLGKEGVDLEIFNMRIELRVPQQTDIDTTDFLKKIGVEVNHRITSETTHVVINEEERGQISSDIMIIDSLIRQIPILSIDFLTEFKKKYQLLHKNFLVNFPDFRKFSIDSKYYPDAQRSHILQGTTIVFTNRDMFDLLKNSLEYSKCQLEFYQIDQSTKVSDISDYALELLSKNNKTIFLQPFNSSYRTQEDEIQNGIKCKNQDYQVLLLISELSEKFEINIVSISDLLIAIRDVNTDKIFKKRRMPGTQGKKSKRARIKPLDSLDFFAGAEVENDESIQVPETMRQDNHIFGDIPHKENGYISPLNEKIESPKFYSVNDSLIPTTTSTIGTSDISLQISETALHEKKNESDINKKPTFEENHLRYVVDLETPSVLKKRRTRARIALLSNELLENTFNPSSLVTETMLKESQVLIPPAVDPEQKSLSEYIGSLKEVQESKDEPVEAEVKSDIEKEMDKYEESKSQLADVPEKETATKAVKTTSVAEMIYKLGDDAKERINREIGVVGDDKLDPISKNLSDLAIVESYKVKPRESQTAEDIKSIYEIQTQPGRKNVKTFVKRLPTWKLKKLGLPLDYNNSSSIKNKGMARMHLSVREYVKLSEYNSRSRTPTKKNSVEDEERLHGLESEHLQSQQDQEHGFSSAPSSLNFAVAGDRSQTRHPGLFVGDSDSEDESGGFQFSRLSNGNAIHNDDGLGMNVRINPDNEISEYQRYSQLNNQHGIMNFSVTGRTNTFTELPSTTNTSAVLPAEHISHYSSNLKTVTRNFQTTKRKTTRNSRTRVVNYMENDESDSDSDDDGPKFKFTRSR